MKNIPKIKISLSRVADLLLIGGNDSWAGAFKKFENDIDEVPEVTLAKILTLFGGMGSFNDIVLYKDGQPLIPENNELDDLRKLLYELCHE